MNSQDWQDIENVRNQAINQLAEICATMGLSWSASDMLFTINLPDVIVAKGKATLASMPTQRKTFDISTWGDTGVDEADMQQYRSDPPMDSNNPIPDDFQMPDYGEILEEGEPPKGDPNAEA